MIKKTLILAFFCLSATVLLAQKAPIDNPMQDPDNKPPSFEPQMFEQADIDQADIKKIMESWEASKKLEMELKNKIEISWKELEILKMQEKWDLKAIKKKLTEIKNIEADLEYNRQTIFEQIKLKLKKENIPKFQKAVENFNQARMEWEKSNNPDFILTK